MRVTLIPGVEQVVEAAVAARRYDSAEACVNSAVRTAIGPVEHAQPPRRRPRILTPRLADPARTRDFTMSVVDEAA